MIGNGGVPLIGVLGVLLVAPAAPAQAPPARDSAGTGVAGARVDRAAREIWDVVMSPFCPGLLLTNCPSSQAAELRDWVRMQLAAGTSRDAILNQLEAAYGEEILAIPRRRGLGLVAWLAPGVVVLGGAVVLLVRLARLSKRGRGRMETAPLDREAQAVVDAELTRL